MRITKINIYQDKDWGCDYTPEDRESLSRETVEAIQEDYPLASVDLAWKNGGGTRVYVSDRGARQDGLEPDIKTIIREVWDRGSFWT